MIYKVIYRSPKSIRVQAINVALVGILLLVALFPIQAISASPTDIQSTSTSETYVFVTEWDNAPLPGTFKEPIGVAVDSSGNVYVADTGNYRIQKFTADGIFITEWGKQGTQHHGEFAKPTGVAVDSAGYIYVADNGYIQKFTLTGDYVTQWYSGLPYSYPIHSLAVDSSNNIYATFEYVEKPGPVWKYDSTGNKITSWDNAGSNGIAVDSLHGYVYVSDRPNAQIHKYDLSGNLITSWWVGTCSWDDGCLQLAVDSAGNVYTTWGKVYKYDPTGTILTQWGTFGSGDGQFNSPQGVAVGPDGYVYVVDLGNNRIQKFTADGAFVRKWGTASLGSQLRRPDGVTVSGNGTVFVADAWANQVVSFTSMGGFLNQWDTMDYPSGMSTDSSGNVYVSGPGVPTSGSRTISGSPYGIRKYSPGGDLINQWGRCCGSDDNQTDWASGIAISSNGNMYVADTLNNRILKLSPDGNLLSKWGSYGSEDGQFLSPEGIAVAPDGSVYVADSDLNRIQKFTPEGSFLTSWGEYGSDDGQFDYPKGIAVDSNGYVYVADAFNDRVQKFDPDGVLVTKWGSYGPGNGQFGTPLGIAVDSNGYVYVTDCYGRIQKFERARPNLSSSVKYVDKRVAQSGDILQYTIILSNNGSLDAPVALVTDPIPTSTSFNIGSLWTSSGNCNESAGVITWTGTMQVGVPVTITLAVTIDTGVPKGTLITNTTTINDNTNPVFNRTAVTIVDPYQVYLPVTIGSQSP
jgi:tripartite motif-containing protein 71